MQIAYNYATKTHISMFITCLKTYSIDLRAWFKDSKYLNFHRQVCDSLIHISIYFITIVTNYIYIYTGEIAKVENTLFDLRKPSKIGERVNNITGGGYDHNFCINGPTGRRNTARSILLQSLSGQNWLLKILQYSLNQYYSNGILE